APNVAPAAVRLTVTGPGLPMIASEVSTRVTTGPVLTCSAPRSFRSSGRPLVVLLVVAGRAALRRSLAVASRCSPPGRLAPAAAVASKHARDARQHRGGSA